MAEEPGHPATPAARPVPSAPVPPAELARWLAREPPPLLLDVRTRAEYEAGHVPGSLSVPVDELAARLADLPQLADARDRGVIAYCESGRRTRRALALLEGQGLPATGLDGDMRRWRSEGRPVETGAPRERPSAPAAAGRP
jgi:rhodanese-related sulfurtransferase